jgi:hypothetical protein
VILESLKEASLWTANHYGKTEAERAHIDANLVSLINNRARPVSDPTVNASLKALAYLPSDVREMIPIQFRDTFDTAQLQVPKGATFATHYFEHATELKQIKPLAPRRSPDELEKMATMLFKINHPHTRSSGGLMEDEADRKAWKDSFDYPELEPLISPMRRILWRDGQTKEIEARKEAALEKITKPEEKVPAVAKGVRPGSVEAAANFRVQQRLEQMKARNVHVVEDAQAKKNLQAALPKDYVPWEMREEEEPEDAILAVMNSEINRPGVDIAGASANEEFLRTGQ